MISGSGFFFLSSGAAEEKDGGGAVGPSVVFMFGLLEFLRQRRRVGKPLLELCVARTVTCAVTASRSPVEPLDDVFTA